jgi:hypothetical protein
MSPEEPEDHQHSNGVGLRSVPEDNAPSRDEESADNHSSSSFVFAVPSIAAFALDTLIVYILAMRISGTLVAVWFQWAPHLLQISTVERPVDWYLQHFEWVTILPALAAGYIDVGRIIPALMGGLIRKRRTTSAALWAWTIPAAVLAYKMLQYDSPISVLVSTSMSATSYYFDIVRTMPSLASGDPVRIMRQLTITAPFYAGIAYSLGAACYRYRVFARIFSFQKPEENASTDTEHETTPGSPSSSPD